MMLDRLRRLELLADGEHLAQVAALDELHDDVILAGRSVLVHGQDFDDVGVLQRHAHARLALEQVDALLVVAPAAAEHLDGDDAAGGVVLAAEDAAETPRLNLVQQAVAAQDEAVAVALDDLAGLPGGDDALALQEQQELLAVGPAARRSLSRAVRSWASVIRPIRIRSCPSVLASMSGMGWPPFSSRAREEGSGARRVCTILPQVLVMPSDGAPGGAAIPLEMGAVTVYN